MKSTHHFTMALLAGAATLLGFAPNCLAAPQEVTGDRFATYANPIDLPYRYQVGKQSYREAADPTVTKFKDTYYLFASHSKGYWASKDLRSWTFIEPTGYDVGKFAPTTMVMNGKMYLAASELAHAIWVTDDPSTGKWSVAAAVAKGYMDPDLFLDDDGKVYMYDGCSSTDVLHAYELDPKTLQPIKEVDIPASRDSAHRGFEVAGDQNEKLQTPVWIEGSWINKYKGRYYLQYSAAGTEYKTYADGLLVSDNPLGPFAFQVESPMSFKPTGFVAGAGHSSTFQGPEGQWWHISTMTISKRFVFERRLGLFPAAFTKDGPVADTYLGDYPHYLAGDRGLTGWMLLSRKKAVTASSTLEGFPAENGVDEDIRTWWSAQTGNPGEWFQIDLGKPEHIQAIQINFADQGSKGQGISQDVFKYILETSVDGSDWQTVVDHSAAGRDSPHDYEVLEKPTLGRFVRIRSLHSPDNSLFSLYDLRVFGNGDGARPTPVLHQMATRNLEDKRQAEFHWSASKGAEFYVVRFGTNPKRLNENYQVYDGETSLVVRSLNTDAKYYFTVDAVNENGIQAGTKVRSIK